MDSAVIPKAEIEVLYLAKHKTLKILEFSEFAHDEIIDGIISDALGFNHLYDSTEEDQLNLIGSVTSATTMYYGCRPFSPGLQVVDLGGTKIGTDSTGLSNNAKSCPGLSADHVLTTWTSSKIILFDSRLPHYI